METSIPSLRKTPVGSSRCLDLRVPKGQCPPGNTRHLPDVYAVHVHPKTLLAGLSNPGSCQVGATHRLRLDDGPYMALQPLTVDGTLHISIRNPGSKEFAYCVRRINSRGYVRFCVYDLFGRFFIFRSEFPEGEFFRSAMEVHEASRGVSHQEFMQAVNLFNWSLKHDGLRDIDWIPSDRSKVLAAYAGNSTERGGH